jgi:ferredoxin
LGTELRVEIDRSLCIAAGSCERLAPSAFHLDGDGLAVATNPELLDEITLRDVEQACPSGAIKLVG